MAEALVVPDGWLRHPISLAVVSSRWNRQLMLLPPTWGFSALLPGSPLGLSQGPAGLGGGCVSVARTCLSYGPCPGGRALSLP